MGNKNLKGRKRRWQMGQLREGSVGKREQGV